MYGFGHVHLSGVGCSELGSVVLMPQTGKLRVGPEARKSPYRQEEGSPGYYRVLLEPDGISCEMTATAHAGMSRYRFASGMTGAHILLDASVSLNSRIMPVPGMVEAVSPVEVDGWTESGHFCGAVSQSERVYFAAFFSIPATRIRTWKDSVVTDARNVAGRGVGAVLDFGDHPGEVLVKVGISYVSIRNARQNVRQEQPGWDFEQVRERARTDWNTKLSRFQVWGGTPEETQVFYTALYHMLIHPGILSDVNGDYPVMNHDRVANNRVVRDHVFSLWDTYRGLQPFLCLFYPRKAREIVTTLLGMYQESGWLPKWELAGHDAYVMVGDPAPVVLAESYLNGITDFDLRLAYQAMKHNANDTIANPIRRYLGTYLVHGYVPSHVRGSVSMTLEYGVSDAAVSRIAGVLGKQDDEREFRKRAHYYRNLYDSASGFLRPRHADGSWFAPFDPNRFKGNGFIEGTAWNYLFAPSYDFDGLSRMLGGDMQAARRLDSLFKGGHYAAYNEPDIAFPYLLGRYPGQFSEVGRIVTRIGQKNYRNAPSGIPGNDDCGALSAWYVFSALGFYPANPLSGDYGPGIPVFDSIRVTPDPYYGGHTLTILKKSVPGQTDTLVKYNGNQVSSISHQDIENGGTLEFCLPGRD